MVEYIKREDLAKHLDILYNRLCGKSPHFYCGFLTAVDYVKEFSDADVAPVVHGRWDDSGRYSFPGGATAVRCTNCGCALTESEYRLNNWNYCPCCGARMDGGADL